MMFHLRKLEQMALLLRNFAVDTEGNLVEDEAFLCKAVHDCVLVERSS